MDCFPPCKECNGLCKVPITTKVVRKAKKIPRSMNAKALNAVIERQRTGYLYLACECITTYEEQLIYEVFFTKRPKGKYWCEKHGNWQHKKTIPKREYPNVPPF